MKIQWQTRLVVYVEIKIIIAAAMIPINGFVMKLMIKVLSVINSTPMEIEGINSLYI